MRLFINAMAASAGGGLTYLKNFVAQLARREDVHATILLSPQAKSAMFPESAGLVFPRVDFLVRGSGNVATRFWFEHRAIPEMIRSCGADVLISAGNFAIRKSPVPQILLSRNALYTSKDFFRDLLARREYRLWSQEQCKRWIAKKSVAWADCTIAPSWSFAQELKHWTGKNVIAIHHGFDRESFFKDQSISTELADKLHAAKNCVRLLFVSHYNYYRNFETLLRALPLIRQRLAPLPVRLFVTCTLQARVHPGAYRSATAAELVKQLRIRDDVVELGAVPYTLLHHVYRYCNLYVTAAYAESFAHPLVEAMASGLPIVASDLAVHREICGGAARYFPTFSPQLLADRVVEVLESPGLRSALLESAHNRAQEFSWAKHVDQVLYLARKLCNTSSELLNWAAPFPGTPEQVA